ncbi:MAG: nucleotidyltransferase domain-containing protein [Ahrensia sp.]
MKKDEILAALRHLTPPLKQRGVVSLVFFGSQARGDAAPNSDLDVALEVDQRTKFSILDLVEIERFITDSVGVPANAFMKRSLDDRFVAEIERDGISVF